MGVIGSIIMGLQYSFYKARQFRVNTNSINLLKVTLSTLDILR
jgi:hypothetical protein